MIAKVGAMHEAATAVAVKFWPIVLSSEVPLQMRHFNVSLI
jgi:hypothetical protein